MSSQSVCKLAAAVLGLALLHVATFAQSNTATLAGQVLDSSGAAVPNASIVIRNVETGVERKMNSDAGGAYYATALPIGNYVVAVKASGFQGLRREGVVLAAGDRIKIDFTLAVGALTESMTVTAEASLVNSTSSETGVLIDSQKVSELPLNGRNFTDLVSLQPGVQSNKVGGRNTFNINGSSGWGLNLALDGTDASFIETPSFGFQDQRALITTVSIDSIEEFRVQTGSFTAETGRASGGAINVITKSGSNDYHGTLFEYFRNDALDARNFFATGVIQKDNRRQNQFGGSLGGPVVRNRIFFS